MGESCGKLDEEVPALDLDRRRTIGRGAITQLAVIILAPAPGGTRGGKAAGMMVADRE